MIKSNGPRSEICTYNNRFSRMCIYPGSNKNDLQYEFKDNKDLCHILLEFNEDNNLLTGSKLNSVVENITNFILANKSSLDYKDVIDKSLVLFGSTEDKNTVVD